MIIPKDLTKKEKHFFDQLGLILRKLRISSELRQEDIGAMLEVSKATISALESAKPQKALLMLFREVVILSGDYEIWDKFLNHLQEGVRLDKWVFCCYWLSHG